MCRSEQGTLPAYRPPEGDEITWWLDGKPRRFPLHMDADLLELGDRAFMTLNGYGWSA